MKTALLFLLPIAMMGAIMWYVNNNFKKIITKYKEVNTVYEKYNDLLHLWIKNKNDNKNLVDYFTKNNYKKIALYGYGKMAVALYDELKNTDIVIKYFIDNEKEDGEKEHNNIPIIDIFEVVGQPTVDIIVVTPLDNFDNIKKVLQNACTKADIVSIQNILEE